MAGGILVIGDVMTDIIVNPEGPIAWGSDTPATIDPVPGGSAANAASWLAACGVRVRLASRVGAKDRDHQAAILQAAGVEPALGADPVHPTGSLVTILSPDGERSFLTSRGANAHLGPDELHDGVLDGVELVHISGYAFFDPGPREAVRAFIARLRRRGLPVTVDPASASFLRKVGPDNFIAWTREASICFPNAEEAAVLAGTADRLEQLRILSQHYAMVVIKRGAEGAEAVNGSGIWCANAPAASVIDTTGAGDAFLAGFLSAKLDGASIQQCLDRGTKTGSKAVTYIGGRPASPPTS